MKGFLSFTSSTCLFFQTIQRIEIFLLESHLFKDSSKFYNKNITSNLFSQTQVKVILVQETHTHKQTNHAQNWSSGITFIYTCFKSMQTMYASWVDKKEANFPQTMVAVWGLLGLHFSSIVKIQP